MSILGIVASHRRLGNTEILVKEALMGAEKQGAEVEIMRWTDYEILPCEGLATCLIINPAGRCKLKDKDDFEYLLEKIFQCDGLIFGSPVYFLEATAVVKCFIDRLFEMLGHPPPKRGKPAAIIMPYGGRGWTAYAFIQPNIMLSLLGMEVIDRALIHTQGMSEVADQPWALERAHSIGEEVATAIKTGNTTYRGEPGVCPVCHDRNIHILKDNENVECGTCGIRGKVSIEDGKIKVYFPEQQIRWHRFSEESIYRHQAYEISPSKDYFTKIWPILKGKRGKYKEYLHIGREPVAPGERR